MRIVAAANDINLSDAQSTVSHSSNPNSNCDDTNLVGVVTNYSPVTAGSKSDFIVPSQSWLRFLVSVIFPLSFLALAVMAGVMFIGLHYSAVNASQLKLYEVFPALQLIDKMYAAICLALAIFALIARKKLKWHRVGAIPLTATFLGCVLVAFLFYNIAVTVIIGRFAFDATSLAIIIGYGIFAALNIAYLMRRRSLFVLGG